MSIVPKHLKDKTKVKIITADPQYPEVGYIDGYVVIDNEPCACVVIGGRIIAFPINQLDVI